MADFKAFWQRFKSGENGGKGQKDRFMLLALVGLLILVAVWPVGGKSGKTSGQTEASVEKKQETSYNYADQYAAVMESRLKSMLECGRCRRSEGDDHLKKQRRTGGGKRQDLFGE